MVEVDVIYEGELHCRLIHGPSKAEIGTDAPKDNMGKGEAFSPTDLVGAALGSCMLTIIGIVAQRLNVDVTGVKAHVTKEMATTPPRRIAKLPVTITFDKKFDEKVRRQLETGALTCPVHKSLHPEIESPVKFVYPE